MTDYREKALGSITHALRYATLCEKKSLYPPAKPKEEYFSYIKELVTFFPEKKIKLCAGDSITIVLNSIIFQSANWDQFAAAFLAKYRFLLEEYEILYFAEYLISPLYTFLHRYFYYNEVPTCTNRKNLPDVYHVVKKYIAKAYKKTFIICLCSRDSAIARFSNNIYFDLNLIPIILGYLPELLYFKN